MRSTLLAAVVVAGLTWPSVVAASGFGGFSADGTRYRVGADLVCQPLAVIDGRASGRPVCERAEPRALAAGGFRTGQRQSADGLRATATGTSLSVIGSDGATRVTWRAEGVVSRVVAVYAAAALVAVEYEVRAPGRVERSAVVFALSAAAPAPAAPDSRTGPPPPGPRAPVAPPSAEPAPEVRARAATALDAADALAARRAWKPALAKYQEVLAVDPALPAACFGEAVALARLGRRDEAVAALARLAASARADTALWQIEARREPAFRALRSRPAFRAAVGLDRPPPPRSELTAYERLLGSGGSWEQSLIPCEQPGVGLSLETRPRHFELVVESRCQGGRDVTRLGGSWESEGSSRLLLVFPNDDGPDEPALCSIESCGDEDCVTCRLEAGLEFSMRPVRR